MDSFAWMEYFMGSQRGEPPRRLIDGDQPLYTTPIVLAEIFSKYARMEGEAEARERVAFILERCATIPMTNEVALEAGRLHAHIRKTHRDFPMGDALILAAARTKGVPLLTGDRHFEGLEGVELF